MPSTTPDLSTVTGGCSAWGGGGGGGPGGGGGSGAGGGAASAKVDGERGGADGRRKAAGGSGVRMRSGFGHASSKLAGGASRTSLGSAGSCGGAPSVAFASARSRSLREVEANSKLRRRGASGAAGGVGASGSGGTSTRGRSRAAASPCHGGGPPAGGGGGGAGSILVSLLAAADGISSGAAAPDPASPGNTGLTRTSEGAPASRPAMAFSSMTTTRRPTSNIPEQTPMVPEIMRGLPRLNSLTEKPNRIERKPATTAKTPAINSAKVIELTPGRTSTRDPSHTIPSYGVPRQRPIAGSVPKRKEIRDLFTFPSATARYCWFVLEIRNCCVASGI